MSESLQIRHGDLALEGNSYATVKGAQKMVQDLRCGLLTPLEFFEEYPEYGSILTTAVNDQIIGNRDWNAAASLIRSEISRVCADYQRQQISRNQFDSARYGRPTISADEMLLEVEGIKFQQAEDKMLVSVKIKIGNTEATEIHIPVAAS